MNTIRIPLPVTHMEVIKRVEQQGKTAQVRIKNQYGQQIVEPVDDVAKEFARIAGTKTLTPPTIESMKRLGYRIDVEQTLPKTL